MKDIVIIGAGGVGKETAYIIEQINNLKEQFNILGFADDNKALVGKSINGYKVLGTVEDLIKKNESISVICAIANHEVKKNIVRKIEFSSNHKFVNIIHPNVYIHETVRLGKGIIIYPQVIMTTNIAIGNHVIISPKCGIGHESIIEDYVSILWNVNVSGNDVLKEGCFIGSGATIIQGKTIGQNSIIGAGSVVVKDIEDNCTAVGIPAKVIKSN